MAATPLLAALAVIVSGLQASDVKLHVDDSKRLSRAEPSVGIGLTDSATGEPGPWEIWAALASDYRPQTGSPGVSGRIALARKFGRYVRPELQVGTGAYLGDKQTMTLIRLGVRAELPLRTITPYLYGALAHQHEMAFEDAKVNPFGSVLGLSGHGEIHRSGTDLGAGFLLNLPRSERDPAQARIGLRVSWLYLLGDGPPHAIDAVLSVGVGF
ncbi:MAG: hypothetical protein IRZ16_02235 [Myxococcaceae bacterium]|nr:hypothetical protein [Myxococcaceae bacterium]